MNMNNLEYLQNEVKFTGFGDALETDLKQNIEQGLDSFKLNYSTQYGKDDVKAELSFSKSKTTDMYFFNSYQVSLQKENTAESLDQTFYINKGNNITLKEAYNLMNGRSVNKELTNKEGQQYSAWVQIDFKNADEKGNFKLKQYHENYGFDLDSALSKHSIKELQNPEHKIELINSLKKGNLQSVTIEKNGQEKKQFIEANPQFKNIKVRSQNSEKQEKGLSKSEKQSESENLTNKKGKKENQAATDEMPDIPKASPKKKKGQSV